MWQPSWNRLTPVSHRCSSSANSQTSHHTGIYMLAHFHYTQPGFWMLLMGFRSFDGQRQQIVKYFLQNNSQRVYIVKNTFLDPDWLQRDGFITPTEQTIETSDSSSRLWRLFQTTLQQCFSSWLCVINHLLRPAAAKHPSCEPRWCSTRSRVSLLFCSRTSGRSHFCLRRLWFKTILEVIGL